MEALVIRAARALSLAAILLIPTALMAASHRTENFIVTAKSKPLAAEIAQLAERYRAELAIEWLGKEMPRWPEPCPIRATVNARLGAGGATSFVFETSTRQFGRPTGDGLFQSQLAGRPFGWDMTLQGSRERILDSVLPHEVTHTIFATHFGRPLPRWADEGACTTVEHPSEKSKQHRMLHEFLTTDRGIAFNRMFAMTEYPADILPLYSQGFSLARFLIAQGGKRKFVQYIGDGLDSNDWTASTKNHYGFSSLSDLQVTWLDWVREGSPDRQPRANDETPPASFANVSPNRTPASETRSQQVPQPIQSSVEASGSWYARQGVAAQNKQSNDSKLAVVRMPHGTRVASRPDPKSRQREVMFEWGNPSPFLSPSLANRESNGVRR